MCSVSIPCKINENNKWQVYTHGGRENWIRDISGRTKQFRGAGELLVTSIDKDGLRNGFDLNLTERFNEITKVPIVPSGSLENPPCK